MIFSLRLLSILAVQNLLFLTILGYKIDQSCTKEGIEVDVRNAMTSAFEMVDAALNRLTASPLDQNTLDLVGKLYAKPDQDPRTAITSKTVDAFAEMRYHYRNEVPSGNDVGLEDVIVYCNTDRFQLMDGSKSIFEDTATGVVLEYDERLCRGKRFPRGLMDKVALAVTWNPELEDGTVVPTQIQLCPWFVEWVKERKYRLQKDAMMTTIGKTLIKLSGKLPFSFSQIDTFNLLDKVLLHEMTHGRMVLHEFDSNGYWQEGLLDINIPGGYFGLNVIKAPAYGWSKATGLAEKGGPLGTVNAADNNSDTLALFGSICKLMDDQSNPRKVDDKGRIVPLV